MAEEQNLPLPEALRALRPNSIWSWEGVNLEGLNWQDIQADRPSDSEIIEKAKEIQAALPWKKLREERDRRMKAVDWITLRSVRTGDPIPADWAEYMQSLADITSTQTPTLVAGQVSGVTWPTRPDGKPPLDGFRTR